MQEPVTDALRDARVRVTGAWLEVETAGDHYRRLADAMTSLAPVVPYILKKVGITSR